MSGGNVNVNSSGSGYVGVMDNFLDTSPQGPAIYDMYWHPEAPPAGMKPDKWKKRYGYPTIPGLLAAASTNFTATGLNLPWYSASGNHDGLLGGNLSNQPPVSDFFNSLAAGGRMLSDLRRNEQVTVRRDVARWNSGSDRGDAGEDAVSRRASESRSCHL